MAISGTPVLVNGVAYSAAQAQIIVGIAPLAGVKSISYKKKRESKNNYGLGSEPINIGYGQVMYEDMSIELDMDTVKNIVAGAPSRDITLIPPFTVKVVMMPDPLNPNTTTDEMANVRFTDDGQDINAGETIIWRKFTLAYAGLQR
jgi:hypothetical protein